MRSISRKKTIVTALAAGSLAVLATTGVAHAANNPAPPSGSSSSAGPATAGSADVPTVGDTPDHPGAADVRTPGDVADARGAGDVRTAGDIPDGGKDVETADGVRDRADGPSDKADSSDRAETGREARGMDADNVQQGDQSGPDTISGATAQR